VNIFFLPTNSIGLRLAKMKNFCCFGVGNSAGAKHRLLLGEEAEASPNIGNTLWRVSTMFTRSAITSLKVNRTDFGRDPRRSESGRPCVSFVFLVR